MTARPARALDACTDRHKFASLAGAHAQLLEIPIANDHADGVGNARFQRLARFVIRPTAAKSAERGNLFDQRVVRSDEKRALRIVGGAKRAKRYGRVTAKTADAPLEMNARVGSIELIESSADIGERHDNSARAARSRQQRRSAELVEGLGGV